MLHTNQTLFYYTFVMASEVEMSAEIVKEFVIDIPGIFRRFCYTVKEISVISGALLVPMARILDAKSS